MRVFFFGRLLFAPLRASVLGVSDVPDVSATHAVLLDHALANAGTLDWPMLVPTEGHAVSGICVTLSPKAEARLSYYCTAHGLVASDVTVMVEERAQRATVFGPPQGAVSPGQPWNQFAWEADGAALALRAAEEILDRQGIEAAKALTPMLTQTGMRAASWVTARADSAPATIRQGGSDAGVETRARRRPYRNFFMVEEQDLRFPRFDGAMSETVTRAAFVCGDAVTVLPYDPVRDRVMMVEQFRFGPFVRGDRHPWSLEPIAGRIDPGESPEEAAHRESAEEAGLTIDRLEPVARYYPSPGAVTEYLFTYVGLADLPDTAAGMGGLPEEAEDIRGVILPFDAAMDLITTGEAENGPLIATLLWLALNRARLRGGG